jgi:predicted transcriptional regulator
MTSQISLPLQRAVQDRLSRGGYATEEELLFAALEALDWRDSLDDSIQAGLEDMAAGRVQPVEGLADRIRERAKVRRGS